MIKTYLVGGAVRDGLLGVKPKDIDYVVVGADHDYMMDNGFTKVGSDFPVYLHPDTGDEYALARTERKSGTGYNGFECYFGKDVTLEDDLSRRDLTINSIAKDMDTGKLIDPFNGVQDLADKILRPTTSAFKDDPVRVLRTARFAARLPDFTIDDTYFEYLAELMVSGELSSLTPERVWKEMLGGLRSVKPSRFFSLLLGTGIFPELENMCDLEEHNKWHSEYDVFTHTMMAVDVAANRHTDSLTRFAVLCHDFGKVPAYAITGGLKSYGHEAMGVPVILDMCARLRIGTRYSKAARRAAEYHTHVHLINEMKPGTIVDMFCKLDNREGALRLAEVAICDKTGRGAPACDWDYPNADTLIRLYDAYANSDIKEAARNALAKGVTGPDVGKYIRVAKINSVIKAKQGL